ncbi:MAG: ATP-binding cassette domain-containing protein, partial [Chloroflexota bacterium]
MIKLTNLSFTYPQKEEPALTGINLEVERGECILVCGKSGCGKSTLLKLVNGIIPNHIEGELSGSAEVNGLEPQATTIEALSADVGSVFQNPKSQFFSLNSSDELIF